MENSKIEWTDHTFNPWMGCSKVSVGCKHCYAELLMDARYGKVQWGDRGTRVKTSAANWRKPYRWNRESWFTCSICGARGSMPVEQICQHGCTDDWDAWNPVRARVFCASLADVFEDRPELIPWRMELMSMIEQTPNLDWLLLTKRPQNVNRMIEDITGDALRWLTSNQHIWIGTSVENDQVGRDRIAELARIPAVVRFLSCEPLLGPVTIPASAEIDWVIAGGESGKGARPMHPAWVRSLRDQCADQGIPFLFKQWGEWVPVGLAPDNPLAESFPEMVTPSGSTGKIADEAQYFDQAGVNTGWWSHKDQFGDVWGNLDDGDACFELVGKKRAGRQLDGKVWNQFPA